MCVTYNAQKTGQDRNSQLVTEPRRILRDAVDVGHGEY